MEKREKRHRLDPRDTTLIILGFDEKKRKKKNSGMVKKTN